VSDRRHSAHPGGQQHRRGRANPPDAIRDALYRQAFGPVRWVEVTHALRARGLAHILECGPGKVLSGLVKRIDGEITSSTVLDPVSLAQAKELLS
jgi:[acyl-carrier-protein] S-malonyltransferase